MTALRAALVRTESIGGAGKELGYEPLVRMSKGEQRGSERAHDSILADCFEAVIGAIYLDQGYETAREFIDKHILVKIEAILEEGSWHDPKSYIQELAQKIDGVTPVYRTLKEEGPDHDKTFTFEVLINGETCGEGSGKTKKEAEQMAACKALESFRE